MDKNTFDALSDKRLGGAWAYITGRVKLITGNLMLLKEFEEKVVVKYFNHLYSKDVKDKHK